MPEQHGCMRTPEASDRDDRRRRSPSDGTDTDTHERLRKQITRVQRIETRVLALLEQAIAS